MTIIDLSVVVQAGTPSPPIVDLAVELDTRFMTPGHWQASRIDMLLHTGSHVDFSLHYRADGEEASGVPLDRVIGEAIVIDLTPIEPRHEISPDDLAARAPELRKDDIILVKTGWTNAMWGNFPDYYVQSPTCGAAAAEWLAAFEPKGVGFDCFAEESAKSKPFSPLDFDVHRIIGDSGAILMQQLNDLHRLPVNQRVPFYAAFLNIAGGEGAPARFFAILDE
jgi:kynurenine formamidase